VGRTVKWGVANCDVRRQPFQEGAIVHRDRAGRSVNREGPRLPREKNGCIISSVGITSGHGGAAAEERLKKSRLT